MSKGNPDWKGYDVDYKKSCGNWGYPGKKQIRLYKLCKKWGKDPQVEFVKALDTHMNVLSNSEVQKEELRKTIEEAQLRLELIEKGNEGAEIINKKLIEDIDTKIFEIHENTTDRWIYAVVKNLSFRYELSYNEMNKIFLKRIPVLIKINEYREKICYKFKFVEGKANNGTLSDDEIDTIFPMPVRA